MHENMTNSEQLKWIFKETGRQIAAVPLYLWECAVEAVNAPYRLANHIDYTLAVRKIRNDKIRNLLDNLTDETLLDRIIGTHEIPVLGEDESFQVPVRVIARRLQLIQDIR